MKGFISDFKRMSVHDGPGIRTTVFLKGCPLSCLWCHNPENLTIKPSLYFSKKFCIGCGDCMHVCTNDIHSVIGGVHQINYKSCDACGKCVEECLSGSLKIYGYEMESENVVKVLKEDRSFFDQSGGGVTFSGGEPLIQSNFIAECMKQLKNEAINIAVDTCGDVQWSSIDEVLPYTDIFLYDIKHIDTEAHKKGTGVGNERILNNLYRLNEAGASVEIRTPVIPGYNDDFEVLSAIAKMLTVIKNVTAWRLLPYHSMAKGKYESLGLDYFMPETNMPDASYMKLLKGRMKEIFPNTILSSD